jgi:hypothetical protein
VPRISFSCDAAHLVQLQRRRISSSYGEAAEAGVE